MTPRSPSKRKSVAAHHKKQDKSDHGLQILSEKKLDTAEGTLRQQLNQRKLSNEITLSTKISPTSHAGPVYFECMLKNRQEVLSTAAVFSGIFEQSQQDPAPGFVDGNYTENVRFQAINISLADTHLDVPLFQILGELVPAGGSFLVSYNPISNNSRVHKETKQALERGYPPVATPLGYLLFLAGCGMGLKGPHPTEDVSGESTKLQGFKALHSEERKRKGLSLVRELHQFIGTRPEDDEPARACKTRAFATIEKIQSEGS